MRPRPNDKPHTYRPHHVLSRFITKVRDNHYAGRSVLASPSQRLPQNLWRPEACSVDHYEARSHPPRKPRPADASVQIYQRVGERRRVDNRPVWEHQLSIRTEAARDQSLLERDARQLDPAEPLVHHGVHAHNHNRPAERCSGASFVSGYDLREFREHATQNRDVVLTPRQFEHQVRARPSDKAVHELKDCEVSRSRPDNLAAISERQPVEDPKEEVLSLHYRQRATAHSHVPSDSSSFSGWEQAVPSRQGSLSTLLRTVGDGGDTHQSLAGRGAPEMECSHWWRRVAFVLRWSPPRF